MIFSTRDLIFFGYRTIGLSTNSTSKLVSILNFLYNGQLLFSFFLKSYKILIFLNVIRTDRNNFDYCLYNIYEIYSLTTDIFSIYIEFNK